MWMNKWMQLHSGEMEIDGNLTGTPYLALLIILPFQPRNKHRCGNRSVFPQNEMVSSEWKSGEPPERPACTKALRVAGSEASLLHGGFHGKKRTIKILKNLQLAVINWAQIMLHWQLHLQIVAAEEYPNIVYFPKSHALTLPTIPWYLVSLRCT